MCIGETDSRARETLPTRSPIICTSRSTSTVTTTTRSIVDRTRTIYRTIRVITSIVLIFTTFPRNLTRPVRNEIVLSFFIDIIRGPSSPGILGATRTRLSIDRIKIGKRKSSKKC